MSRISPELHRWIEGFSKLDKEGKRRWLVNHYGQQSDELLLRLHAFDHGDRSVQDQLDRFAENTIANFVLPLGIAPNFLIDDEVWAIPMAIEESSVVAAASAAAKYWSCRGGFRTQILGTEKIGQIFFKWGGSLEAMRAALPRLTSELLQASAAHTVNMEARGGGVLRIELHTMEALPGHYELRGHFETRDSMGANFINTVLEAWAGVWPQVLAKALPEEHHQHIPAEIIMAILSNYTPECRVRAEVSCRVDEMGQGAGGFTAEELARRFSAAVDIARCNVHRAVTHNKGILNGIDAVVIATGNDFRAIEAGLHAYAARDGQYRSLSNCALEEDTFRFWLEIPLALGTVGGLTKAHPLAAASLELLGHPSAEQLMRMVAAAGLAQNFAAVRSLVTTGIQSGHMRMHLHNLLHQLGASPQQSAKAERYFADKTVSMAALRDWLQHDVA